MQIPPDEERRQEPFEIIAELVAECGIRGVLEALSDEALFISEDPQVCSVSKAEALGFHEGIEELLK